MRHRLRELLELEPRLTPTATPPVLVTDLQTSPAGSFPANLFTAGGTLYFAASDGYTGLELWKSDGGTPVLVKDINPGANGSNPSTLIDLNGTLIFLANDGTNGVELWRSDGTNSGTQLIRNINTSILPVTPTPFDTTIPYAVVNDVVYFAANEISTGVDLWRTDGTSAGTYKVRDFNAFFSNPVSSLVNVNGTLYLAVDETTNGREVWKSDGTSSGTQLVANIAVGSGGSGARNLTNLNGTLVFTAGNSPSNYELWKSDGTSSGTVVVKEIVAGISGSRPEYFVNSAGTLFFIAQANGTNGPEIWKSDGTSSGTVAVRDITPNPLAVPTNFAHRATLNGVLYFRASDGSTGQELWRTDGTSSGTFKVRDFNTNFLGGYPSYLSTFNGELYFVAQDSALGTEIFRSDGTSAGTGVLKDIAPGVASSRAIQVGVAPASLTPGNFGILNNQLYFQAGDALGMEFWTSDGTSAGTQFVADLNPGTSTSSPQSFLEYNGQLFYTAADQPTGSEPRFSNGTGSTLLRDLYSGPTSSTPRSPFNWNGTLYFTGLDSAAGTELFKSDGTSSGTGLVIDLNAGTATGVNSFRNFTTAGGKLLFVGNNGSTGEELWSTDGTSTGTILLKDIRAGTASSSIGNSSATSLFASGGLAYFLANDGTTGTEVWRSDGTSTGTVLLKDLRAGSTSMTYSFLTAADLNGTFVFAGNDGSTGTELWKSDGTSSGTVLVQDLAPGSTSSSPSNFRVVGNTLYFTAFNNAVGTELYRFDGTTISLVRDIAPSGSSFPSQLWNANGTLFFTANDGVTGPELWKSDGTSTGTVLVKDITPGSGGNAQVNPSGFTNIGSVLFFAAGGPDGTELWRSDGTSTGTTLLEVQPGFPSNPSQLTTVGDRLFFAAFRRDVGVELFTLRELPDATVDAVIVNGGAAQRSRITSLQVNFTAPLDVTIFQNPGAVTLTRTSGGPATVVTIGSGLVITPGAGNSSTLTLTFITPSNAGVDSASLADGQWQLAIPSLNFTSALNDLSFRRLFGDADANGTVDGTDFAAFGSAFGSTGVSVAFDFDNNNTVDGADFAAFGSRFGITS